MALEGLTPAQVAGIDLGFRQNRWQEFLELSLNGNGYSKNIAKPRNFIGYTIKLWDQKGNPVIKKRLKTEFKDKDKAREFLKLYEMFYPNLVFFVDKKYE